MLPKYYEFFCPVKILCGRKAVSNLPYELAQLGVSKPLVVTDKGVVAAGLLNHVKAAFGDDGKPMPPVFEEVPVDSSHRVVARAADFFRANGCDSLVAVGGGSVIDTAKGINMVVSEGTGDLLALQGVDRLTRPQLPLVAIPTTAGTGSEVTNVAVVYNEEANVKMGFMSARLYPSVAIVDPAMTVTMPPRATAATGMDALTHAVEAYTGLQKNPVSDAFARAAIELVGAHLVKAVKSGRDAGSRLAMSNAALLAGIAFANSMVGMVHALAHACGGICHVPHGVANAILLPWGMEYNKEKSAGHLAEIAVMLGETPAGRSAAELADRAIVRVRDLLADLGRICGLPTALSQAGVPREKLPAIAKAAANDGAVTYNPTDMTVGQALELLERAY
jgi:alcohol dehydrogenase